MNLVGGIFSSLYVRSKDGTGADDPRMYEYQFKLLEQKATNIG